MSPPNKPQWDAAIPSYEQIVEQIGWIEEFRKRAQELIAICVIHSDEHGATIELPSGASDEDRTIVELCLHSWISILTKPNHH